MFSALVLLSALTAQSPHPGASPDAMPPEEVAAKEAVHLTNIKQVTFGFAKAGEGYFRPDGQAIIFQAVPNLPPSIFHTPTDNETDYQIYTADLAADATPQVGQHRQRGLHLQLLRPRRQVDPLRLVAPESHSPAARKVRRTAARSATSGSFPKAWTSSAPISTAGTSTA